MTDISIPQGNSTHQEDISPSDAGTAIVGRPCVIWNLVVSAESTGVGVVSFSDSSSAYDSSARVLKVVLSGAVTETISFPKGLYLSSGLSATANKASVDVSVVYD